MRANNFFTPAGTTKGKWAYHQFGATLGGPIQRNKLFFFGSYENTRDHQFATRTISVPTDALRRGDLTASSSPIYDPATGDANGVGRTPFPGNIIPTDRMDATALKLIGMMPLPNLKNADGSAPLTNNYFIKAPFNFDRWTLDTKVNWNATPKLNIFGRYSQLDFWTFNETVYGDLLQGMPIGGGNPGTGTGRHLQLFRRRHLCVFPEPRRRRALWLRATVRLGGAHRHWPEQGSRIVRPFRTERAT